MTTVRTTQVDRSATRIDFGIGQPGFDLLPHDILASATAAASPKGTTICSTTATSKGTGASVGRWPIFYAPTTPPPSPRTS
ncbi:MAG: hypothetical protein R2873_00845 [Caldilineaceae bacterium]